MSVLALRAYPGEEGDTRTTSLDGPRRFPGLFSVRLFEAPEDLIAPLRPEADFKRFCAVEDRFVACVPDRVEELAVVETVDGGRVARRTLDLHRDA